ncbi:uncharacterized protein PV07_00540 [Cladophialophora immunda]|uniref:Uncharacterized protein n=1 Tax=Cladophialophora immunda TaxID=569365 RepID=A0A0D2B7W5_9EURO|nr:uncharacterized protein PV07_00540 [Cladophialophora immunda]KIW33712.1 hypothetical protein PV07_00540 [Cladophialophora immunda]
MSRREDCRSSTCTSTECLRSQCFSQTDNIPLCLGRPDPGKEKLFPWSRSTSRDEPGSPSNRHRTCHHNPLPQHRHQTSRRSGPAQCIQVAIRRGCWVDQEIQLPDGCCGRHLVASWCVTFYIVRLLVTFLEYEALPSLSRHGGILAFTARNPTLSSSR